MQIIILYTSRVFWNFQLGHQRRCCLRPVSRRYHHHWRCYCRYVRARDSGIQRRIARSPIEHLSCMERATDILHIHHKKKERETTVRQLLDDDMNLMNLNFARLHLEM